MRKSANLSLVAFTAVALLVAGCGGSKTTPSTNSDHATPNAGASSIGGSSAAGGASSTGGASSAGAAANGGSTAVGCQVSAAPATALIADFLAGTASTTGLPAVTNGGMYTYPAGGASAPAIAIVNGALHVTINTPASAATQYVGYGIFFNDCTNGGQYTGVKFDIGGTMTGCGLQFINNFRDDATPANDVKGSCAVSNNCYGPQTELAFTTTVASSPHPFVTLTAGFPVATVDTKFLTGLGWGFVIPAADPASDAGANCVADFTIDNVTFY
jgi:hypothetical protein